MYRSQHRFRPGFAVQQQNLDHLPCSFRFAVSRTQLRHQRFVVTGPPARLALLAKRGRATKRSRFHPKQLQIVIELQALLPDAVQPVVPRDLAPTVNDHHVSGADPHFYAPATAHRHWNRISISQHRHPRFFIDSVRRNDLRCERLGRQRQQVRPFLFPVRLHRLRAPRDLPLVVLCAAVREISVQLRKARDGRHRHQVVPAESPHAPFHAPLLVRAFLAGPAKLRLEQIVRSKRHELRRLLALPATQDLLHGRAEVVEAQVTKNTAEIGESQRQPLQEGLLRRPRESHMKLPAACRRPHFEKLHLRASRREVHVGFVPVHLPVFAGQVRLRHEQLAAHPERLPAKANVAANRRFRPIEAMLHLQPGENPMGRVSLLPARLDVGRQPAADDALKRRRQNRARTLRFPPLRRN